MCLSSVQEQYDTPSTCITDGWKEFDTETGGRLKFQSFYPRGVKIVPTDEWIPAETTTKVRANDGKTYEAGFHVWKDEHKSKRRRRVFVRLISAMGSQDGEVTVIAREMYVPSDPNDWPPKPGEPSKKKEGMLEKAKNILKPGNA